MRTLLILALLLAPCIIQAGTVTGRVSRVTDGNTLVVVDANHAQHKIRLLGIAAPARDQAYGSKSKQRLAVAVAGKFVVVEYEKRDRHERLLGKVLLNKQDINLEQIKLGLAWHYLEHHDKQTRIDWQKYADAELDARRSKRGMWDDRAAVSPWGQRKYKRDKVITSPPYRDESEAR